jgi:hypothetical protein
LYGDEMLNNGPDFTAFPMGGVNKLTVQGITPPFDAADTLAFPIEFETDGFEFEFTMISINAGGDVAPPLPTCQSILFPAVPAMDWRGLMALAMAVLVLAAVSLSRIRTRAPN